MGEKYLKTKDNSLEASVLDVWKDAAKLDEYKTKIGEKRRVAGGDMRRTENKVEGKEATGDKEEYTKFFNAALKKFGVKSPAELKGKKEKEFYDYVDKNWKADHEEELEDSPNKANSQHLCAKNVVHEEWGEGQPVHGMHDEPDADGNIAWYDVMFEHGIEKGVSINELKVKASEMHHNHGDKKKINAMAHGKKKMKKEEVELEKQHESKMQSLKDAVRKVWEASDREKIENKRAKSVQAKPGKTMTGDDMSVITVNPEIKG